MMDKLLGQVNLTSLSFVDHKMLFSTHELKVLKDRIQAYTGKNWIESILSNLDHHEMSCFSEYETYGCTFPSEKGSCFHGETRIYLLHTWSHIILS